MLHRVVIVGAGFGGLHAAQSLRRAPVSVTVVDRRNFHLFQPLLYQVATGALSPANISMPIRSVLKRHKNAMVLLGDVTGFDLKGRRVVLEDRELDYDTLVVATGARHHYFQHAEWEPLAPGLKTIEEATEIRRRILYAFEAAERETDVAKRAAYLRFVIVGGGPTGVEMAGAIAELSRHTLKREYRNIDSASAEILLIEADATLLNSYPADLSEKAIESLRQIGVTPRMSSRVEAIEPARVLVRTGDQTEWIATHTVVWAAGVRASPLGKKLAEASGAELDRAGRVMVQPDLTLPGNSEVFVIGDLANCRGENDQPLPGIAPVAVQQGRYVARTIRRRLAGKPLQPFHYRSLGQMATIGPKHAVAEIGWLRFSGLFAWLAWLFIHLLNLVGFQNRLLVLIQWGWNYWTRNRAARLITETPFSEEDDDPPSLQAAPSVLADHTPR